MLAEQTRAELSLREEHRRGLRKAPRGKPSTWSLARVAASAKGTAEAPERRPAETLNMVTSEQVGLREGHRQRVQGLEFYVWTR